MLSGKGHSNFDQCKVNMQVDWLSMVLTIYFPWFSSSNSPAAWQRTGPSYIYFWRCTSRHAVLGHFLVDLENCPLNWLCSTSLLALTSHRCLWTLYHFLLSQHNALTCNRPQNMSVLPLSDLWQVIVLGLRFSNCSLASAALWWQPEALPPYHCPHSDCFEITYPWL